MKISNKTTIYQRIKEILKFENISVNGLSKDVDMVQTTLNKQLRGDTPLPITTLLLVISRLSNDISLDWLLTGEGSMLKTTPPPETSSDSPETPSDTADKNKMLDTIVTQAHIIERQQLKIESLERRLAQNEA